MVLGRKVIIEMTLLRLKFTRNGGLNVAGDLFGVETILEETNEC